MSKIDKTYHTLLNTIIKDGFKYEDPNRKGTHRIQIPSYTFEHHFEEEGFPLLSTKKLYWKGAVGELLGFLNGFTTVKDLSNVGVNFWDKDAYNYYKYRLKDYVDITSFDEFVKNARTEEFEHHGDLGNIYSYQLRNWGGEIDQFRNLIEEMKTNPMRTKKTIIQWNPIENAEDMKALTECHWSWEILVEPVKFDERVKIGNKLNVWRFGQTITPMHCDKFNIPKYQFTLKWHQHSVDTFLGLPINIAYYSLLAKIIGKLTNMVPKGIIGDLSNVHIYEPHMDAVNKQLLNSTDTYGNLSYNLPEDVSSILQSDKDLNDILKEVLNYQSSFSIPHYESYPRISADMIPYSS